MQHCRFRFQLPSPCLRRDSRCWSSSASLLGNWQTRRAAEKIGAAGRACRSGPPAAAGARRRAAIDPAPASLNSATSSCTGEFSPTGRCSSTTGRYEGRAGFHLLMPFKLAGSHETVLVARGWLPRERGRSRPPAAVSRRRPATSRSKAWCAQLGRVHAAGRRRAPLRPGAIVQNLDPAAVRQRQRPGPCAPFVVEQAGADIRRTAWCATGPRPSLGVDPHQGYAFQWYALAAMASLFFVMTGFRRGTSASQ